MTQPHPRNNFKNIAKRWARYEDDIKKLQSQLLIQTQVATCNHMAVKANNLRRKSSIHDRVFEIFEGTFLFNLRWIALFCFFKILTALYKFELKYLMTIISVPMICALGKLIIDYYWSLVFNISCWQATSEMASNKKEKASRRNTKDK